MAYRLDSPRQAWSRIGRRRTRTPNGSHMGGGRTRMAGGSKAKTTTRTGSGSVPITPTRDIDRRDIVEKRPSRRTLRRPQPSMMGPGRQTIHLRGGPARTVRATSLRHGPRQQRRGAHRRRRHCCPSLRRRHQSQFGQRRQPEPRWIHLLHRQGRLRHAARAQCTSHRARCRIHRCICHHLTR